MIEKVNMSPVIMEKIMVTKGPVSLIALKHHLVQGSRFKVLPRKEEEVEPASRDGKDKKWFLNHPVVLGAHDIFRIFSLNLSGRALFRPYSSFIVNQFFQ